MSSFAEMIRESRLGKCWKCMTFSVVMLILTSLAGVVSIRLYALEDSGFLGSTTFAVLVLIAMCAFALLTAAHFVCLILRRTIWSDARTRQLRS